MNPSLQSLEFDRVLAMISLEAKSEPGRQTLSRRMPRTSLEECEEAQATLAEMVNFYQREGLLPFAGLIDVGPLYGKEHLDLEDSWQLLRAIRATQALRETLVRLKFHSPLLQRLGEAIDDLSDIISAVARYFTKDGKLRDDATPELRSLRSRIHSKRTQIQRTLLDIIHRHGELIQDPIVTVRGDRYCIPVRAERRNDLPGILHERSGSGASVFIEPLTTVELNNDLADLLLQERAEIARITSLIASRLAGAADRIRGAVGVAGELDAIQACAILHRQLDATRPEFSADRRLELLEARHPLLDERLADLRESAFGEKNQSQVVPTTLLLGQSSPALVISGPNAGGKTVTLKTAGLITAMAMAGLPVAAREGSVIPVVDSLHVLIGDDQDLLQHLSTFSAYLVRLKGILAAAGERSMVLLDELGSGTDPEEGAALAAAVIEQLLGSGCLLIATTHLTALKNFAIQDSRISNASMEFDSESGRPTFQLIQGIPGRSRAIEVAAMIGLPAELIRSARARLGDQHGEVDRLLSELQKQKRLVSEEHASLERQNAEMEGQLALVRERSEELERERRRISRGMREELERTERDVRQRLEDELRRLRAIDRTEREKVQARGLISSVLEPIARLEASGPSQKKIDVGDRVEHRRFKLVGTVSSIDGSTAWLASSGKKLEVDLADLVPAEVDTRRSGTVERRQRERIEQSLDEPAVAAELNLVGRHVEEALEESDRFIDQSLLAGKAAVRLIHGHGTGALRKALREYLKQHPGVKSFRPGSDKEGGDGATVAILDV